MKMIKLKREYSVAETYVHPQAIEIVYKEFDKHTSKEVWHVLVRSGVTYDITEETAMQLIKDQK